MWFEFGKTNNAVVDMVVNNQKRAEKLCALKDSPELYNKKVDAYITAACREVGVKLSSDDRKATHFTITYGFII